MTFEHRRPAYETVVGCFSNASHSPNALIRVVTVEISDPPSANNIAIARIRYDASHLDLLGDRGPPRRRP